MPEWWSAPSLNQCYRALDAVAAAREATEEHLYSRLCDLSNLDLRLVCYDLASTYFEGPAGPSWRFGSRAFGYSRDHRSDRPQIVIGLLCTTDGIPIAHHVFAGGTNDATTLPAVLEDLAGRFRGQPHLRGRGPGTGLGGRRRGGRRRGFRPCARREASSRPHCQRGPWGHRRRHRLDRDTPTPTPRLRHHPRRRRPRHSGRIRRPGPPRRRARRRRRGISASCTEPR